ncbi:MAG: tRNA (N(6)-L-threonylcarbamoyladenosine(37)-C(2))-methylthiotransferase MtaB [Bacteroidetes bacterium]|nr:tRNA (N(6)-L-threonylcarbamoyladenosine(37)-C(2))-methylthiotransferase MtaB [Bacteroidota bacterium]
MAKTVAFYTLGCKLNYAETSTIGRQLAEHGMQKATFESGADIYVINTCSVTDHADKKCRKVVKEALRWNSNAFVVIIGCYAQLKPAEISQIPGVDLVLGAAEKFNLVSHLSDLSKKEKADIFNSPIKETNIFIPGFSEGDRTRTFMKVQDGCDYFCTFCTIPLARGASRSANIADTIKRAEEIANTGVKEVVLTGVNLGDFGINHNQNFLQLIQELDNLDHIERFRISSIEPNLLNEEIISFVASSKKFVPHFHIPLQSGSDEILKKMRRRYERNLYEDRVSQIKKIMPHCAIGVDVIVGFPGETEDEFLKTYDFLNALDISYLHVFPYSERPNTTAAKMKDRIPVKERMRRGEMLRILSEKKRRHFYDQHVGTVRNVLFEKEEHGNVMNGFTDNYIKISAPYDPLAVNEVQRVILNGILDDGTMACEPNFSEVLQLS